jgi:hypothetical protein
LRSTVWRAEGPATTTTISPGGSNMPNSRMLSPWNAEVIDTRASDRSTTRSGVGGSAGTEGGTVESTGPPIDGPTRAPAGGGSTRGP